MGETFFVCFYKDKDGDRVGHGVSNKNDFPEKLGLIIDAGINKNDQKVSTNLQKIFKEFCDSMNGYMDMLPLVAGISSAITYTIRESELNNFCEENKVSRTLAENREIFELPLSRIGDFQSIDRLARSGQLVSKQIPKMLLMGVVSSLDHHLAQLMREIVRDNPKLISSSEKNVSVQDVFLADSIDEFKDFLLEREIDTATRNSFEDQISWFEKKLNLREPIQNEYELWSELVEVIERRNLFAHANGIINSRYLKKIGKREGETKLKVGQELYASSKYFSASLDNICEFGIKIAQVVWRRIDSKNSGEADDALGDFGFSLIERGEYKLAARILEFANSLRGKKDEGRRRMDVVNLANAYRLDGDEKKAEALLASEDWAIVSDQFAISVAAVRGDVDRVIYFMNRMVQSGDWTGEELEQWPVFFHVRDDPRFIDAFEKSCGRTYTPAPKSRNRILEKFMKTDGKKAKEKKQKSDNDEIILEIGFVKDHKQSKKDSKSKGK